MEYNIMPVLQPKKIAYLFGAGATHAELANLEKDPNSEKFLSKRGLRMSDVSKRVMEIAVLKRNFLNDIEMVSSTNGSLNIELFISLIENSKIGKWETKIAQLKKLVKNDIEGILKPKKEKFYLHKALFELHGQEKLKAEEKLIGLISLNYDSVLDEAYKAIYHKAPDYCFCPSEGDVLPLLKLHGSFNWNKAKIRGRKRTVQIIPLGANKNYLHSPYNTIWNKAFEILIDCDILRIVGCSLSQNDFHLIDLLFKAHLDKGSAFEMEIISSDKGGQRTKNSYGFFPQIKSITEIDSSLVPESDPINPFKTWLKYKILRLLKPIPSGTRYLKKVIS